MKKLLFILKVPYYVILYIVHFFINKPIAKYIYGPLFRRKTHKKYWAMQDIYDSYVQRKEYDKAYGVAQELFEMAQYFGPHSTEYVFALFYLGIQALNDDKYDIAEEHLTDLEELIRATPFEEHEIYTNSILGLGIIHGQRNNFKSAENYFLQAVALCEKNHQTEMYLYPRSLEYLAELYFSAGQLERGERIMHKLKSLN